MTRPVQPPDQMSDPVVAARAWARYRWLMRWVVVSALLSTGAALYFLRADGVALTVPVIIATSAAVALTILLGGALMGLVFLSAGSGHYEDVAAFRAEEAGSDLDKRR